MLIDLCYRLADLHRNLLSVLAQHREDEAMDIADKIVDLEGQILSIPGETLSDAAVKLQLLKTELEEQFTVKQRQAFEDATRIVCRNSLN